MSEKRPKITIMGEEIPWEEVPSAGKAADLADYFKPVKLSRKSIDSASKIVPSEHWIKHGIYTWLQQRADHVFSKMSSDQKIGKLGVLRYFFGWDADGAVLENVSL